MALKIPQDRRKAGWVKTMLEGLETQWKLFFETDLKLQRHAKDEDHKTSVEYHCAKNDLLNAINQGRTQFSVQSDQTYANTSMEPPAYKNPLPLLDLPKFSCKKSEWESYKGMFVALVHNLPTYHSILKLQYRARSLQEEAALHLRPPPYTGDKYDGA